MEITVYGSEGCSKCTELVQKTREIIEEKKIEASVIKEEEPAVAASKGILELPGFSIDGEILFTGSNPPKEHVEDLIEERI